MFGWAPSVGMGACTFGLRYFVSFRRIKYLAIVIDSLLRPIDTTTQEYCGDIRPKFPTPWAFGSMLKKQLGANVLQMPDTKWGERRDKSAPESGDILQLGKYAASQQWGIYAYIGRVRRIPKRAGESASPPPYEFHIG